MCGLFGIISTTLDVTDIKIMHHMSYLTCFRGTDSTGVIGLAHEKKKIKATISKAAWNPVAFFESKKFHTDIMKHEPFGILAHSRSATVGDINDANAHPFHNKHIMGMHNGTIHSLGDKNKTDSEELIGLIANQGIDAALDKAKYGAYALVYVDSKEKTINFIRNHERPLHFVQLNNATFLYASERKQLEYLASIHTAEFKNRTIESFPVDTLHSYDIDTMKLTTRVINPRYVANYQPPWYHRRDESPETNVVRTSGAGTFSVINTTTLPYPYNFNPTIKSAKESAEVFISEKPNVKNLSDYMYQGWRNFVYTIEEAKNMLLSGCMFCGTQVVDFAKPVFWYSQEEYLCPHCQTSPLVQVRKDDSSKGQLVRVQ